MRGKGGYRKLIVRSQTQDENNSPSSFLQPSGIMRMGLEDHSPVWIGDTLVMGLWIVRLQHCSFFPLSPSSFATASNFIDPYSDVFFRNIPYLCYSLRKQATVNRFSLGEL